MLPSIECDEGALFFLDVRHSPPFSPRNNDVCQMRSLTYYRLPPHLLKLSIVKLDGSSFEVNVGRTASVLELKQAVEDVFSHQPTEGEEEISCFSLLDICQSTTVQLRTEEKEIKQKLPNRIHWVAVYESDGAREGCEDEMDERESYFGIYDKKGMGRHEEFKISRFFRGWLSVFSMCFVARRRRKGWTRVSRLKK